MFKPFRLDLSTLSRRDQLKLRSAAALVIDQGGQLLYAKEYRGLSCRRLYHQAHGCDGPLDSGLSLDETITIERGCGSAERDTLKLKLGVADASRKYYAWR